MRSRSLCAAVALSFLATGAAAQDFTAKERLARFQLFSECGPMQFVVALDADAAEIGLTEDALRAAAESRLQSARLYSAQAGRLLYLNVNVVDRAFGVILEYKKWLPDPLSGEVHFATTWQIGSTGTTRDSGYILSTVSEHLDRFLAEYLRVNEEACT